MLLPMNTETQHRKKDPIRLYQQLLESAAMIAGRDGIAALLAEMRLPAKLALVKVDYCITFRTSRR